MKSAMTLLVLGLVLVTGTAGATELDVLEKKVRKYAKKTLCVCQNHGSLHGEVGRLSAYAAAWQGGGEKMFGTCWIQRYTLDGDFTGGESCDSYVLLTR